MTSTIVVITVVAGVVALVILDLLQTDEPVRRRFPGLVWGRKFLTALGPLLRQYLYLNDREETPYNRITRDWIYRTARGKTNNVGFGSQEDMDAAGSVFFLPATFTNKAARLGDQVGTAFRRVIGGRGGVMPVAMPNFVYISGMSYGALSY